MANHVAHAVELILKYKVILVAEDSTYVSVIRPSMVALTTHAQCIEHCCCSTRPASAADLCNKGRVMCYHVNVILYVQNL